MFETALRQPSFAGRSLSAADDAGVEMVPPVHVGVNHRKPLKLSRQIKDYLLCEGCEGRFRRQGEDWMTANGYHADGSFPLRHAALKKGASFRGEEGTFIYETRGNLAIKMDQLVYFCMSVFWRAGAHTWRLGKDTIHLELGPYREPLRLFLLNEGSLPDELCLIVRMASVGHFGRTLGLPISEKHGAFRGHHFTEWSWCPYGAWPGLGALVCAYGPRVWQTA